MEYKKIDRDDINFFKSFIDAKNIIEAKDINEKYTHDEMTEYGKYLPDLLIRVSNEDEVIKIMKYCHENYIPVTPRGAGTGLCGGSVCIHGGILLSLELMNKVIEIDHETLTAVVEPGVLLMEIIKIASDEGFLYAPDPGEKSASLGGNVMTNAGGMKAVKYGVTRDYVKGMEVVLPTGELLKLGGKLEKNSSGYSIKDLIIGSEGTLGIVTKLYLKLLAKPKKMISLLIPFDNLKDCLNVVPKILGLPNRPTTLEFCEKEVIEDAKEYLGKSFPSKEYNTYLIVSYTGANKTEIEEIYKDTCELVLKNNAIDVFISDTDERQDSIWSARGAFLEAINNSTTSMDECDVVVSINKVYEYVSYVKEISKKYDVRIRMFGHAGDGNLHAYVCKDNIPDEKWKVLVHDVMKALYDKANELNGLTSGEHGIGHAKKQFLKEALGETQIRLMKDIKKVFDPHMILNPGKVID